MGSDCSVPAELGQESQAMSFLRNGTPLASRVVHRVSPGDIPDPGVKPASPASLTLAGRFFITALPGKLKMDYLLLTTCTTLFGFIGAGSGWRLSSPLTPLTLPWWGVLEHVLLLQRGMKDQLLAYPTDTTPARRLGVHHLHQ